jgi:hypothetical protein
MIAQRRGKVLAWVVCAALAFHLLGVCERPAPVSLATKGNDEVVSTTAKPQRSDQNNSTASSSAAGNGTDDNILGFAVM